MVLLKKKEGDLSDPRIYTPICLLNEAGKLFERVIVTTINEYLRDANALSENQFGFRAKRSTLDAILRLRAFAEGHVSEGGVVIAVGIDISNAFNSLPWRVIRRAMMTMGFPSYLYKIISEYLRNRRIVYIDCFGNRIERQLSCGVPQGSMLGPTLWNIGYNGILGVELPKDCSMLCYADDMVVLAADRNYAEAAHSAMVASYKVISEVEKLGLKVAPHKPEAMVFPANVRRENKYINIKGIDIEVCDRMK